jgi:hypothetical protein
MAHACMAWPQGRKGRTLAKQSQGRKGRKLAMQSLGRPRGQAASRRIYPRSAEARGLDLSQVNPRKPHRVEPPSGRFLLLSPPDTRLRAMPSNEFGWGQASMQEAPENTVEPGKGTTAKCQSCTPRARWSARPHSTDASGYMRPRPVRKIRSRIANSQVRQALIH